MRDSRLGDVIDDFCVKCRRLTNHSIVSLLDGKAAKVRCRTCYSDHDYRNEQAPPSKKDLKKAALFNEVLSSISPDSALESAPESASDAAPDTAPDTAPESAAAPAPAVEAPAAGAKKTRSKKT